MAVDSARWLSVLRRYAIASAVGHFAWEGLQLPLYRIWYEGTTSSIAFAVGHCTGGDIVIASAVLFAPLLVFGQRWPDDRDSFRNVAVASIVLGAGYTVYSEWLNVSVRASWAYSDWMPLLPPFGTGLSPLLQWIVVPAVVFYYSRPQVRDAG